MNGITILRGRTPLRLLPGEVDQNNNPDAIKLETEPGKRMIEACEEYVSAMSKLQKMEVAEKTPTVEAVLQVVEALLKWVLNIEKKPTAAVDNEMQLEMQSHYVEECMDQAVDGAVETLCLGGDSEIVFYALYEALINKSGGVMRPKIYGIILEQVVKKMIRQLMDQREMIAISEHLSTTVGKTVGTDESGKHGLQGQVEELTAQVLERSIALGPVSDIGRRGIKLGTSSAKIIEGARIGRMQFDETEGLIKRLVQMLIAN